MCIPKKCWKPYEHEQVEDEDEDQGAEEAEDKGIEGEGGLLSEDVAVREDVRRLPLNTAALSTVRSEQEFIHETWKLNYVCPFRFVE